MLRFSVNNCSCVVNQPYLVSTDYFVSFVCLIVSYSIFNVNLT